MTNRVNRGLSPLEKEDYTVPMASILIKDTTKEERAKIVAEALGDECGLGCGFEGTGIDYQLYIDGIKELRELNMEANCGFVRGYPEEDPRMSCLGNE